MSRKKTFSIRCPSCGALQEVELYDAVEAATDLELKQALLENRLNRVECADCSANFRVDMPLLYSDAKNRLLIYWIPETAQLTRDQIVEDFERSQEELNDLLPDDVTVPVAQLVFSRVELVELIFMIEAGLNQRVVEYVKYSIYTRNLDKVSPRKNRLLLNVQDSTADELCFVVQDAESQGLGKVLRYGRAAYQSLSDLFDENPEEFFDMFPGPCISARNLLLEDEAPDGSV